MPINYDVEWPKLQRKHANLLHKYEQLEDLFLQLYELGSSHPQIEGKVEATVARVVERQSE